MHIAAHAYPVVIPFGRSCQAAARVQASISCSVRTVLCCAVQVGGLPGRCACHRHLPAMTQTWRGRCGMCLRTKLACRDDSEVNCGNSNAVAAPGFEQHLSFPCTMPGLLPVHLLPGNWQGHGVANKFWQASRSRIASLQQLNSNR